MDKLPKDLNVIRVKETVANKALGGAGTAFMELAGQVALKAPAELTASERDCFCNPARVKVDFYPRVGAFATEDKARVQSGNVQGWKGQVVEGLEFIWCERHFYQPLLTDAQKLTFPVSPIPLNKGEAAFVKDVQQALEDGVFAGYETYLLRNQTGQGSVSVFIDGGFYPDFILWLVKDNWQKIIFIDPKGLRHHKPDDPARLHRLSAAQFPHLSSVKIARKLREKVGERVWLPDNV
jgi:hypothetical protein